MHEIPIRCLLHSMCARESCHVPPWRATYCEAGDGVKVGKIIGDNFRFAFGGSYLPSLLITWRISTASACASYALAGDKILRAPPIGRRDGTAPAARDDFRPRFVLARRRRDCARIGGTGIARPFLP